MHIGIGISSTSQADTTHKEFPLGVSARDGYGVKLSFGFVYNAAMIGAQGFYEFEAGHLAGMDLNGIASLPIDVNYGE